MEHIFFLTLASLFGMTRGVLSLAVEHPLDVIKTYWQANPLRRSFVEIALEIYHLKGYKGFYSGAFPNMIRVVIKQGYRYPLMIALPFLYGNIFDSLFLVSLSTGLTIAFLEGFIITPFERFKVWLMTYSGSSNGIKTFMIKLHNQIVHVLYRGLKITIIRQVVSWVTFLVVHDQLIFYAKNLYAVQTLSIVVLLIISLVEGAVNTIAIMPFDCIKTQQQKANDPSNETIGNLFQSIYRKHGLRGLYLGWTPKMIQYMIHSAFTVTLLERLKEAF